MAIEQSLTRLQTSIAYELPKAYLKVDHVEIRGDKVTIMLSIFADAEARAVDKVMAIARPVEVVPLADFPMPETWDSSGMKKAAYQHIKTIEKYKGSDLL